jgi:hypothetical protein
MMKRLIYLNLLMFALVFTSCSTDEDSGNGGSEGEISDAPLTGKLFGQDFEVNGSRADYTVDFGEERITVQLSNEDIGCETGQFSGQFPISISTPPEEGYTTDVYVIFSDPDSDDFVSVSGDLEIEVTSLSDTEITAKIRASTISSEPENHIEGKFTASICPDDEG